MMTSPDTRKHKNIHWDRVGHPIQEPGAVSTFHTYGYNLYHDFHFTRRGSERPDALLLITLKGTPSIWHGNQEFTGRRGMVTYYPAGSDHRYSAERWECLFFHFYPSRSLLDILAHYKVHEGCCFPNLLSEAELERLSSVYAFPRLPPELEQHRCGVLIEHILFSCLTDHATDTQAPNRTPVEHVANYIQANPGEDLSIETLARQAHLSPSRFSHSFKEQFGKSVRAYVIECRMAKAKYLLSHTTMTGLEISSELAFRCPYHFYAAFKKYTGMTTLEWRSRHSVRQ